MSRRQTLLAITDPAQVSSGLQPDRHSLMQPLWESASNAMFYQGKVKRLIPHSTLFAATVKGAPYEGASEARGLHQQQYSDGTKHIFVAWYNVVTGIGNDTIQVDAWDGTTVTNITDLAVSPNAANSKETYADFTSWGDWTIINIARHDQIGTGNYPYLYKPAGGSLSMTTAPLGAITLLKKNNQLFAIGHGPNRRLVSASDADDINDWTPTATNLSIELPLEDLDSPIRAGTHLGSNIAVYGDDQLAFVFWVGAPDYWGRRMGLDGIGAVGKRAVIADGPLNYGVSRNGCWVTDGSSYRYIDQGVLHDYLEDNVNWANRSAIQVMRNDVNHCIEFHFPMGANVENSEAWSYDPATSGWWQSTPYHVSMERKLYDNCIAAKTGVVYLMGESPTTAAALSLSTKPLLMQTPQGASLHEGSLVDEIEIFAKAATNIEFRYGVCEDIDGSFTWTSWTTLQTDLTTYRGWRLPSGVFHKLELRSIAANWSLDLQGFIFYGMTEGSKRSAT